MIIDVNAYIGHYPFRSLKYHTADELVALMDKYRIAKSCVASLNAVYYRDCMQGNYELIEEIAIYGGRLIPFCVINPEYNWAKNDLKQCAAMGFKGLRLFPKQQGYKLDGAESIIMLRLAAELNMPVHIPIILEDLRGRHPMDVMEVISPEEIKNAASASPDTNIILSNYSFPSYARVIKSDKIYYDIGRLECLFGTSLEEVVKDAGFDHLIFGSGAMLQNIPVQLVKIHYLENNFGAKTDQIEGILSENLRKMIGF